MKYKIGDKFLNELEITEINQEKAAPYFLSGGQGVGWWSEAALMDLRKYITGGWVPVGERLPEDGINPVTQDAYAYPVTVDFGNVRDIRYYSFCCGHWYNSGPNPLDDIVIAWMPISEPYRPDALHGAGAEAGQYADAPTLRSAT